MERSSLRVRTGMRYELLNPILDELAREGRIKMTVGKQGDSILLIVRSVPFRSMSRRLQPSFWIQLHDSANRTFKITASF